MVNWQHRSGRDNQLIAESTRVTEINTSHLEALAIGAGILGTGGGGNPYLGKLHARNLLRGGKSVPVVSVNDLPEDAVVCSCGGIGSPTVGVERLKEGGEFLKAMRALERYTGKTVTHMISAEIGGSNSISPITTAIQAGLPVVDGDGMGRAFPELQMDTYSIYGILPTPCALADVRGHIALYDNVEDATFLERYARVVTVQMGGGAGAAGPLMSGSQIRHAAIPGTLTLAVRIGEAVLEARERHLDPIDAALGVTGGETLFRGKITDVERLMIGGFARGKIELDGSGDDSGRHLSINFQNENLVARTSAGEILCSVPDLICIVDAETAEPITTEILRYGLRVAVLGIPAPAMIATPEALAVVGPAAFGYPDVEYKPLAGTYGSGLQLAQ
jgi:hypothetical protein